MVLARVVVKRSFAKLVALAALALLAAPLAAGAQPAGPVPRIGLVSYGTKADTSRSRDTFVTALRALGYVEGRSVMLDERYAMGRADRIPALVAELVSGGATLLVTGGPYPSVAARRAVTSIPIVFVGAHSPVELGLVASLARPGGNVTGVAWDVGPEMQGKQLELLKEAVLRLTRVAFLGGAPGSPEYGGYVAAMEAGARSLDLRLQVVNIAKPGEYDAAFRAVAAERAEAVTVAGNSRNLVNRKRIHDFTARNRLPAA